MCHPALVWRLVVQRLMDALGLMPDAVELPADLAFGQRRVAGPVDLLGLVVPKEALDAQLIIGTLNPRGSPSMPATSVAGTVAGCWHGRALRLEPLGDVLLNERLVGDLPLVGPFLETQDHGLRQPQGNWP